MSPLPPFPSASGRSGVNFDSVLWGCRAALFISAGDRELKRDVEQEKGYVVHIYQIAVHLRWLLSCRTGVNMLDLKHLTGNSGKEKQTDKSICLVADGSNLASRALRFFFFSFLFFPHTSVQNTFVSQFAQVQLKPSLCKSNNSRLNSYFTASFKARNLHPIEFYGSDLQTHSTPQPSKYVSQIEKSILRGETSLRDVQE